MNRLRIRLVLVVSLCAVLVRQSFAAEVPVKWLDPAPPAVSQGVSFGVPWAKGTVQKDQVFSLKTADGKPLPLQNWPLAYWQDGSIKWTGFATVAGPDSGNALTLATGEQSGAPGPVLRVVQSGTSYLVDTGRLKARIEKWGSGIIESMSIDGREVARNAQLVCISQDGPDGDAQDTVHREKYVSKVEKVTLEQSGPVRAVFKIEGKHKGVENQREWLPFVVRLYFYAGQESVRMVHTILFDGDQDKDFIRGLGVNFSVPMREEIQNRHVAFSGEDSGLWAEPIQPMIGRGGRFVADPGTGEDVYALQIEGQRVPNRLQYNERGQSLLADWAVWDDFKLVQPNADGFTVLKRTNPKSTWLQAGAAKRASGLVFAGDVSGGLAVSLKNFWQSYPSGLEVRGASSGAAQLMVWMWSPDAPGMDLRHYDTKAHGLEAVYEDVQPGLSTPYGVGRTSELMLFPTAAVPSKDDTVKMAQQGAKPPVLVCTPRYLHDAQAFGIWGLEDRTTPVKQAIEERLDYTINYYLTQPDQRNWYGYWYFGDVMHSYDDERHVWRYDLGGMAWDNGELGTDMWLWYSFLHTGRADIFRMAEAMTRHTGEVVTYHFGPMMGLGSRHNVIPWGCGAKEARISQSGYRRFYYYLTTDERVGDVMRETLQADFSTLQFDPMRLAQPATEREKKIAPTRVRLGPDWFAFCGNWLTEWERTGDTKWRDKILAGVQSMSKMSLGLRSGRNLVFGYDPASGKLFQLSEDAGTYNLATIMGGAEVVFEMNMMLDDPTWEKLWLQYCRLYSAPRDMIVRDMTSGQEGMDGSYARDGRLASYVYLKTQNPAFLQFGLDSLVNGARGGGGRGGRGIRKIEGSAALHPIDEGPSGTNGAAQNGLETITMLGMIGDKLPAEFPAQQPAQRGRGGRGARGGQGNPRGGPSTQGRAAPGQ
jgi:hypothetical protein